MKNIFERAKQGEAMILSKDEMRFKDIENLIDMAYDEKDNLAEMLMDVMRISYYAGYRQGYNRASDK